MQTLASGVWRGLSAASPDSVLLANDSTGRAPVLWLLSAVLRTLGLLVRRRVDLVLAGDAVAYALVWPVTALFRTPSVVMVHGLDLTYDSPLYRLLVSRAIRRAQTVLANSEATAEVARDLGIAPGRVHVLRLGIDAPDVTPAQRVWARIELNRWLGTDQDDVLCLTLGRVVKRKGAVWFVDRVMPRLPRHVVYLIAGEGDETERVERAASRLGLGSRVRLLGRVNDAQRELLLRGVDIFVQPNIRVPGDMEGFGLVCAEAATRGLLVVAADIEGVSEAVVGGVTGNLVRRRGGMGRRADQARRRQSCGRVSGTGLSARCALAFLRERHGRTAPRPTRTS